MRVYIINPVTDNPLFDGLALEDHEDLLDTEPSDWIKSTRPANHVGGDEDAAQRGAGPVC